MKKNKKAFSLLEVLLAVAIMLIASTMVMQGFMSTLSYSANTAIYAKSGATNSTNAVQYVILGTGTPKQATSSPKDLTLSGGTIGGSVKIRVNTWKATTTNTIITGGSYGESAGNTSSNRYAISYALPDKKCPNCHSGEYLAKNASDKKWYCTHCNVYVS
jgi:prepilin-type N-terminal cleavage/methylation domain-containing protein